MWTPCRPTAGGLTAEDVQKAPVFDVSAEAEVDELGVGSAAPAEQDVLQLDIAVHDVRPVHILHLRNEATRVRKDKATTRVGEKDRRRSRRPNTRTFALQPEDVCLFMPPREIRAVKRACSYFFPILYDSRAYLFASARFDRFGWNRSLNGYHETMGNLGLAYGPQLTKHMRTKRPIDS